jgi:hypothetical protein
MTVAEAERLLSVVFEVCEHITTFHLTGGGEPFLHPQLPELVHLALKYADKFERLMLFSNSTIPIKAELLDALRERRDKIVVQLSQYGIIPEREIETARILTEKGVKCKVEKYCGDAQPFGGWVDFGKWQSYGRTQDELKRVFRDCAVTRDMRGNWRTRDGRVHWCTRSQRGMGELGFIPDNPDDYVDLFDETIIAEKRAKFEQIALAKSLLACDYCSGNQGTTDSSKRFPAADQE